MVKISSEDEDIKKLEDDLKKLESLDYGSPEPQKKEGLFKFFREILSQKDTTRIGNLSTTELGVTRLGVRPLQELSLYADAEGLDLVADYLSDKADVLTSTSMSKKGFWSKLFVTQIKHEKKETPKEAKKSWLGKKEEGAEE